MSNSIVLFCIISLSFSVSLSVSLSFLLPLFATVIAEENLIAAVFQESQICKCLRFSDDLVRVQEAVDKVPALSHNRRGRDSSVGIGGTDAY